MTSEYYALIFFQESFLTLPLVLFSDAYSDQSLAAHLRQTFFISQDFSLYPALSSQIICTVNSSCLGFLWLPAPPSQPRDWSMDHHFWAILHLCRKAALEIGISSLQFSCSVMSTPQPIDCSISHHPVHHQLLELAQTHVYWVGDAIQPSHPLSSPSPPAFNLSQHQGLSQWVSSSHQMTKVLEFQLQHQSDFL